MRAPEVVANEVMLLGGGMEIDGDIARLTDIGQQRADRFLDYYHDNEDAFTSRGAFVLCTGGAWILSEGLPQNEQHREGFVTADYLMANGVPKRLIRIEDESNTTLGNVLFSVQRGLIKPADYSPEHQLGVVSHPHHIERAKDSSLKVGFVKDAIAGIPTEQEDSALREFVLRAGFRVALLGTCSLQAVAKREAFISKVLS